MRTKAYEGLLIVSLLFDHKQNLEYFGKLYCDWPNDTFSEISILTGGHAKVISEFFKFSLRKNPNKICSYNTVSGVLRNERPLDSKFLFATVLSFKENS